MLDEADLIASQTSPPSQPDCIYLSVPRLRP